MPWASGPDFIRAQEEYEARQPPAEDFDCTCNWGDKGPSHWDCEDMLDETKCECEGHPVACDICGFRECQCDAQYEAWRESRLT